jgi:hypothetical protein
MVDPATTGTILNQADVTSSTPEASPSDESVGETTAVGDSEIFSDGFEPGNTSAWSNVFP